MALSRTQYITFNTHRCEWKTMDTIGIVITFRAFYFYIRTISFSFCVFAAFHFDGAIAPERTPNEFVAGIDSTFPFKVSFHAKIMAPFFFQFFSYYVYIIGPLRKVW